LVQFKYAWLIDESSAKEIKAADKLIGVFEVRTANPTFDKPFTTRPHNKLVKEILKTTLIGGSNSRLQITITCAFILKWIIYIDSG